MSCLCAQTSSDVTQQGGKWRNKPWRIHVPEYYSAKKRNDLLKQTVTWLDLEDVMLNERSETENVTQAPTPLIGHSGKGKAIGT